MSEDSDVDYPESGADAEDIHEEESLSDQEKVHKRRSRDRPKWRKKKFSDDDDDDDDDDDEEYDDEEEDEQPKKKRFGAAREFFLDEVEVDDDDEEELPEEGMEDEAREAEAALAAARLYERRRNRAQIWKDMTEDEINQYFKNKYSRSYNTSASIDDSIYDDITQKGLLPSASDPNLWYIKCRIGEEKTTGMLLMRKFLAYQNTEDPLLIKSIIVKEGLKGMIYIEAYKMPHVMRAIEGVSTLYKNHVRMVPIKETPDVFKVIKDTSALKPGVFVRVKRSVYKDDIAQAERCCDKLDKQVLVDWVDLSQKSIHLKLIPRIDYTRMRGAMRNTGETDIPKKRKARPPAKFFDLDAVRAIGGEVGKDGEFYIFEGNRYSRQGFLYKSMAISAVEANNVKPSLAELEKFQVGVDDLKSELANTLVREEHGQFAAGDVVEVVEGELLNLRGKVTSVDGDTIHVQTAMPELKGTLKFSAHELRKHFVVGDHVKVISGRYEGDTGLIVSINPNCVILMTDLSMSEIQVLPKDVQLCRDVSTGVHSSGTFQHHDLVMIDAETVGVIVQMEREYLHVLNQNGKVVRMKHQSLYGKKNSKYAVALDCEGNNIGVGDVLKVIDGPNKGLQGEVKHLYRSYLFMYSTAHHKDGGMFVCRARHVLTLGLNTFGEEGRKEYSSSPRGVLRSPMHPGGGGAAARGQMSTPYYIGRGRVCRDYGAIGKSVRIIKGPMKGYHGMVKDATESTAQVELHATCKTISVERSHLEVLSGNGEPSQAFQPYKSMRPPDGSQTPYADMGKTPRYGSHTPMYGSQTPMHEGGRTPYYGSQTPMHDGSRTPSHANAWDPTVPNTPARRGVSDDDFEYEASPVTKYGGPASVSPATPGYSVDTPLGVPYTPGDLFSENSSPFLMQSANSPLLGSYAGSSVGESPSLQPSTSGLSLFSTGSRTSLSTPSSSITSDSPKLSFDGNLGEWVEPNMEVVIRDYPGDRMLNGRVGLVQAVTGDSCTVFISSLEKAVSVYVENLEPSKPLQGDKVKIIRGEDVDSTGLVISIDGVEGVVKTDSDEIRLVNMAFLCKMVS
ncbi:Transcription elongation factor SPT5 [Trichinella papuae]|uniref:Transcription elongation factor SPT5 n=1 Tax=Trichinella papuae TaxID=268474 RepID=A0A0V1MLV4_9BILA|nr:Transcription elongation factor SPT5 [Trichinella papuae]